jgi:hypothetical protein
MRLATLAAFAAITAFAAGCAGEDKPPESAAYQRCYQFAQTHDMTRFPLSRAAAEAGVSNLQECGRGIDAALGQAPGSAEGLSTEPSMEELAAEIAQETDLCAAYNAFLGNDLAMTQLHDNFVERWPGDPADADAAWLEAISYC